MPSQQATQNLDDILSEIRGVQQCTCRYWMHREEEFAHITLLCSDVSLEVTEKNTNRIRLRFSTPDSPGALCFSGIVTSASISFDGMFSDISLQLGDVQVHIIYRNFCGIT